MLLSKCTVCEFQKLRFIIEQEASGLLNDLGLKAPFSKISLLGYYCFKNIKWIKKKTNFYYQEINSCLKLI